MEWIEPGVRYLEVERVGELAKVEEIHTIEIDEPHQRYRFSFEVPDATETASLSRGSREIWMIPARDGTNHESVR